MKSANVFKNLLINRHSIRTLGLLVIQQLIAASSTLWLVKLMEGVVEANHILVFLFCYLASLLIVYIPAYFMDVELRRWDTESFSRYIKLFARSNQGMPSIWNRQDERELRTTMLSSESHNLIQNANRLVFDLSQLILNIGFNVVFLAGAVSVTFLGAYGISLILIMVLLKFLQKPIEKRSQALQECRLSLNSLLWNCWDNLTLGNRRNLVTWEGTTDKKMTQYLRHNDAEAKVISLAGIIPTVLAMIPVLALIVFLVWSQGQNKAFLAALLALLPRHIQILNNLEAAVRYGSSWHSLRAQFDGLLSSLRSEDKSHDLEDRIAWPKIKVIRGGSSEAIAGIAEFVQNIHSSPVQRWTVIGENGAGKTSLLLLLKAKLGADALYLPAKHDLLFPIDLGQHSSGQKTRSILEHLAITADEKFVLLDEWDANLDEANMANLSKIINELSQKCHVIEIRHRGNRLKDD